MKLRKRMAWLMSILMIVSLVMGGVNITPVKAAVASVSVSFRGNSDQLGKVQIKVGDTWTDCTTTGSNGDASALKIVANEGYEVDWTGICLFVNDQNILTDDIRAALTSDNGYALTDDTSYTLEGVEFRTKQQSGGANPPGNDNPPASSNYEITFRDYDDFDASTNTYTYNIGETSVTLTVSTTVTGDRIEVPCDNEGSVTFTLTNFDPDTMKVEISEPGGFNTTLAVVDGSTSLQSRNNNGGGLPDTLNLRVVGNDDEDNQNPPPDPGNDNPPADTGNDDITLNVTGDVSGNLAEIKFNDRRCEDGFSNVTVKGYNASHADKTNKIEFAPEFGGARIVSATINGIEYPCSTEGLFIVDVPAADSYSISIEFEASKIVTIIWSYEENPEIDGIKVEHGKVEIVSITRGDEIIYDSTHPYDDVVIDENGGWVSIEKGDDVVLKVIPDYGYQIVGAVLNEGREMEPQEEVSTFLLEDIQGNVHFSGVFEKTADTISKNSEKVKDVSIANGENAAQSGTLSMTVGDNTSYSTDVKSTVGDKFIEKVGSVDISLNNLVSKGTGESWTTPVTEFTKPISVSLELDEDALKDGETYDIVRDHNGTLTALNATYDAATGTLTFETNQFSTYTIVKTKTEEKNDNDKPSEPEQGKIEIDTTASDDKYQTKLDETSESLAKKIKFTEEEKQRIANGESVKIYLDVKDAAESVTSKDKTLVENAKGKAVVGMYLDISLFKQIGSDTPQSISETDGAVTISLNVPSELINSDTKITRTYKIVRIHEGVATILDCKFDAATNKLSFETDAFSIYALVYTDTVKEAEKTGDMSIPAFWFALAALSGAGALYIGRKQKKLAE